MKRSFHSGMVSAIAATAILFLLAFRFPGAPHVKRSEGEAIRHAQQVAWSPEDETGTAPDQGRRNRVVLATAYNAMEGQTDDTPEICAWGDRVRPGIIAVSRDLEKMGLTRGTEVHIKGLGKRVVMDRMHGRKKNQIDIYMEDYRDAVRFGVQDLVIEWEPNQGRSARAKASSQRSA
jgi:3D (Asp-Asp-Asp) domain-containing protein